MSSKRYQGKIIKWQDDRGFGFIKVPSIKKDIFLHISALKTRQSHPKVGDTVYFDLKFEEKGKLKAVNASFTKAVNQPSPRTKNSAVRHSLKNARNVSVTRNTRRNQSVNLKPLLSFLLPMAVVGAIFAALPKIFSDQPSVPENSTTSNPASPSTSSPSATTSVIPQNCDIKGNISYPDGKKFYHKPGDRDYAKVEIFTNEGERWFCSEQEAINAGWKDAANR
ncbi:MAG: cold shock domain-containing protein [Limnothrix sp.]